MLSGSSQHIPKSLINKNSCYFTSSFTSMETLVDMNGLVYVGAHVGQTVAKKDVYEI